MADITPVTREEFYLAKAGGQDVPVPSAVTREEHYLEKLSNDSVVVPSPVTRREKFLYFACGGEIDLPSEERMTRLEKLIAKAGGMDVSTPTAVTRLEKFWAKVESGVKTITGVLPLTFTAKGGTAVDWTIYGNDDVGENLVPPIRTVNGWKQGYRNYINGNYIPSYTMGEWLYDVYIPINSASFTFWATNISTPSSTFYFFDSDKQYLPNTSKGTNNYNNAIISNISPEAAYMQFAFRTGCMSEQEIIDKNYQVMLVKGSTAPDHYIPYQQGVGERTEQLINCSTISGGILNEYGVVIGADATTNIHADSGSISFTTVTARRGIVTDFTEIKSDVEKITLTYSGDRATNWRFCFYDSSQTFISQSPGVDKQTRVVTIPNNAKYFRTAAQFETAGMYNLTSLSITKGSTAPSTYIPYGYQIPLTVSQQGQTDKSYNIYIGDSPLTAGQSISKTSTGQDIELFDGENTVSTTLYNKPTMEIKYK